MNRLKKELVKRELVKNQYTDLIELDCSLVFYNQKYIVVAIHCNVLDSYLKIYDTNFNLIARQNIIPDYDCMSFDSCFDPWDVYIY